MIRKLLKRLFGCKPRQTTGCYCPGCGKDLVSMKGVEYRDTDLVRYYCPCGQASAWDFDAPVPLLIKNDLIAAIESDSFKKPPPGGFRTECRFTKKDQS